MPIHTLKRLEYGRKIVRSLDFGYSDVEAERAGRRLNPAYLQHATGSG
jgi:hypothetical protein